MCDPASAMLALSIGTTALSFIDQANQADAATDSIKDSYELQAKQVQEQQKQINANAQDDMSQRAREATIERGRLKAIQGESGLIGNTADRIMNESYFNEESDIASIESNRVNSIKQSSLEAQGLTARTQSELNSIKRPSALSAGLQIGTAVAGYKQATAKPKTP
ncbi:hypothetical protein A7981_05695 [Methylovorus sp. MM2]|uniref:virion core protein, T7 gp14 family n=1 Tax=Methylovorus sp. MM2 TaxID=1848038 RepID=UPI0007E02B05|nr:hypothetical protein [Methylovorus sp. MM2]OAM52926.1 hypothetical protein A7981_05695 [Methylovorus sp. MM2]